MSEKHIHLKALSQQLLRLTPQEGFHHTAVQGVVLMRVNHSTPPLAVLQEPTLVLVLQGSKRGYLGKDVISFQAGQCLIVSVPIPFDCDTVVENDQPMLAIAIQVDAATVSELLSKASFSKNSDQSSLLRGMTVIELNQSITDVAARLLTVLPNKEDSLILGSQLKRELIYRVMQSPGGELLQALLAGSGKFSAIYQASEHIQRYYAQPLNVHTLASGASMSVSAFHQAFKRVTGQSPMQYLKITRLHKARELMLNGDRGAAQAAFEVGYASASQFSSEFKRLFGYPPGEAQQHRDEG